MTTETSFPAPRPETHSGKAGLSATVESHLRAYFDAHEQGLPSSGLYSRVLQEVERPLLSLTLSQCRGNQLRAAEIWIEPQYAAQKNP